MQVFENSYNHECKLKSLNLLVCACQKIETNPNLRSNRDRQLDKRQTDRQIDTTDGQTDRH